MLSRSQGQTPSAVVVGAGIAGLASGISLARAGWHVTVLERAAELDELGAGFAMSPNAVAAFRGLGFDQEAVAALGAPARMGGTWSHTGQRVLNIPDSAELQESLTVLGVHRRRLHTSLQQRAAALGVEIRTGTPVTELQPGHPAASPAVVAGLRADLVIAADGMHSAVRRSLFPEHRAVYSGYSSWRAIVPHAGETQLRQYWGPWAEFGTLPVSAAETYWYGYIALPEGTSFSGELAQARRRFLAWPEHVRQVLDRTPPEAVMRHDVHHLPGGLPSYARGRVVLLGDAAHGFLPTLGQGAASALEDGCSLGPLVGEPVLRAWASGSGASAGTALAEALRQFDAARRPRNRMLARGAQMMAQIGSHLGPGWRQTLRNRALSMAPAAAMARGSGPIMDWRPPASSADLRPQ